jgi:isoleucyl-tRNA synthetase
VFDWEPEWGKARMASMLENRPDWCISRQRSWGVPIPLLVHKDTGDLHPETNHLIEEVAKLVEENGIDAWHNLDCSSVVNDADQYDKISDSLDVWFDSGVTHACVLNNTEMQFPADLYLEGSDQHRGWFQSSLLTSLAITGNEKPYRSVVTHGFTVDANGLKMSKSRGNVIAPQKVMNVYGADILRLWVAATDYRTEMNVSDEILKRIADAYRRIRNTSRYLLSNLNDFDPKKNSIDFSDMLGLDKWIIEHAVCLQKEIITAYDNFEFHLIYQLIHQFCVVEMGGFYLDIIKDRQYTTQNWCIN